MYIFGRIEPCLHHFEDSWKLAVSEQQFSFWHEKRIQGGLGAKRKSMAVYSELDAYRSPPLPPRRASGGLQRMEREVRTKIFRVCA